MASRWVAAVAVFAGSASAAWAQTWNGASTTSNNWSAGGTGGNWSGAAAPVNNGTANVIFGGSTRLTPNQDQAWSINSLAFSANANAFDLGGSTLTIGAGGIANNSTALSFQESISNAIVLSAGQTWTGTAQGIQANGPTLSLGNYSLTLSIGNGGAGNAHIISNAISGTGPAALTITNCALLLEGSTANTFTGAVGVYGGSLQLDKTGGAQAIGPTLSIGNGTGSPQTSVVQVMGSGEVATNLALTMNTDGLLQLNGYSVTFGTVTMTGGLISLGTTPVDYLNGNFTVNASPTGAAVTASDGYNDVSLNGGTRTFNIARGTATYDLDLSSTALYDGALLKTGAGILRLSSSIDSTFSVTLQQGTIAVGGNAALGTGTLALQGGNLQPDGNSITLGNPVALTSYVGLTSAVGTTAYGLTFSGLVTYSGSSGFFLSNSGNTTFSGGITSATTGATLILEGAYTTQTTNNFVILNGGNVGGTVTIGNANVLDSGASISAALTNTAAGTFTYELGTFSGTFDNLGTLILDNLTFLPAGGFISGSPLTVPTFYLVGAAGAGLNNQSVLTLAGGSLGGTGPIVNNDLIVGTGAIGGSGGFTNYGTLSASTGPITFSNSGLSVNYGNITTTLGNGLILSSGVSLTNSGALTLTSASISGPGALTNAAGGDLTGVGLITAPFYNAPGGVVYQGGGALAISSPFTNAGLLQVGAANATISGGAITNTGSIQGLGTIGNAVNNTSGTIEAIGGTLGSYGGLTNGASGTIAVDAGAKVLVSPGLAVNAGVISLTGGTYDNGGAALNNTGYITGYGIIRTGGTGLTNSGVVTLTGGTTTVNGPVTNAATHSFTVQYNPAIFTGFFQNNGTLYVTATTASFGGGSGGGAALGTPTPNSAVSLEGTGGTVVSPGAVLSASGVTQSSLTVQGITGSYGRVTIPTQEPSGATPVTGRAVGQTVSILGTLNIASNGSGYLGDVDLADNDLIVTGMTEAAIRSYVASWYDGGKRDGLGLSSDLAGTGAGGAGPDALATLAVIANSNGEGGPLFSSFDGIAVTSSDVLVKYTYLGDTNLDGVVDGQDLANTLAGLSGGLTGWVNGDFTYTGSVTSADVTLLLNTLAHQTASFGDSGGSSGAVPEPSGLLWAAAVLPVLGRRRR